MLICKWALEDDLILSLTSIVISVVFSCLFCSFSPFAFFFFASAPIKMQELSVHWPWLKLIEKYKGY